jgi:hypothetical protein
MSLYLATHKRAPMPTADWLVPIGLGGFTDTEVSLTDNRGDNISSRNRTYCELTATYWLWKHCDDPYIGLCHYRRFFSFIPIPIPALHSAAIVKAPVTPEVLGYLSSPSQRECLEQLLEHYDVVVPRPVHESPSIAETFRVAHGAAIWDAFTLACRDEFGSLAGILELESRFHYGNMLVARTEVFRDYCARLFRVVDHVAEKVGDLPAVEGARYQPFRYPGYLGERFTNLYLVATRRRTAVAQSVWFD